MLELVAPHQPACSSTICRSSYDGLPVAATMSLEVDILPIAHDNAEAARLADLIEGGAGEFSSFEELHGFSIDGVDLTTSVLPAGWRDRLVRMQNSHTAAPGADLGFTGWCLDKEDLCVAKLCAHREKDRNFVAALLDAGLVDPILIESRLGQVDREQQANADVARLARTTSLSAPGQAA